MMIRNFSTETYDDKQTSELNLMMVEMKLNFSTESYDGKQLQY